MKQMFGHAWHIAGAAVVALALTACGSDEVTTPAGPPVPPGPGAVTSVTVSSGNTTLRGLLTSTAAYTAVAKDANDSTVPDVTFTWASSDAGVATIASTGGSATSHGLGTATISASTAGITGTSMLTVEGNYVVNVATGSDTNAGTGLAPYRTITKALSVAVSGNLVKVMPGRYSDASGETFPLAGAAGVQLIGDEANKGGGATPTTVVLTGGGYVFVFTPPANMLIAGFTITDSADAQAISATHSGLTLRNNRLVNSSYALFVESGANNLLVTGNLIDHNSSVAVAFVGGGATGSKFENNTITNNYIGIEYDAPGADLGGGAEGSVGGNILSCNSRNDIWATNGLTITASNNKWDHVPLTSGADGGGVDFYGNLSSTITFTGATAAPGNCI